MNTDSRPAHGVDGAVVSVHLPFPSWVSGFVTQLEEGLPEAVTAVAWHAFSYYPQLERLYEFTTRNVGRKITRLDAARVACVRTNVFLRVLPRQSRRSIPRLASFDESRACS